MAKLQAAIKAALTAALSAATDGIVRVDLPSGWPLVGAIGDRIREQDGGRVRVGVLRPFAKSAFSRLECDIADDPSRITKWRNDVRRAGELIVCGRADAQSAAGLRDFARVVRRRDVIDFWATLEGDVAATSSGKPEVRRLITAMFDECLRGRIDARSLDEYLSATAQITPRSIDAVFTEMWRARLIPDDQVLDKGASTRRLELNLDIVARLEAGEERELKTRLRRASQGTNARATSGKAALAFMKSAAREDLKTARLADILEIIGERSASTAAERAKEFEELLDELERDPECCATALQDLVEKWTLESADLRAIEIETTIAGDEARYRLQLDPSVEKVDGDDDEHEILNASWIGDGDAVSQVLVAWRNHEKPEAFDGSSAGWKRRTAAEFQQVLNAHSGSDAAVLHAPLAKFIDARAPSEAI